MRAPTRHRFVLLSVLALLASLVGFAPPAQAAGFPSVATILPQTGPLAGGTMVQIKGTDFADVDSVTIGLVEVEVLGKDETNIFVTAPPRANPGKVSVNVTSQGSGFGYWGFEYLDPDTIPEPQITAVNPKAGSTGGGRTVTITGTGLANAGMPRATVWFGDVEVESSEVSDNYSDQIRVTAPAHVAAPDVPITVETEKGRATSPADQRFTYIEAPTPQITSISPNAGPTNGNQTVTIKGTGLWNPQFSGSPLVRIGHQPPVNATVVDDQTLTVLTPAMYEGEPWPQDVSVITPVGDDTLRQAYTYVDAPYLTTIEPSSGNQVGGDTVTITGFRLINPTVSFDGVPATNVQVNEQQTQLTAVTPAHDPGPVDVVVAATGGTSNKKTFTYLDAPVLLPKIDAVIPSSGPEDGGQAVQITGSGLHGATKVWFGDNEATQVESIDDTTVNATTPAGTVGSVTVKVEAAAGTATGLNAYTYNAPPAPSPTVTKVEPASGSTAGGQQVTITGTDLTGATSVKFDGKPATNVSVVNATKLTAKTPAHAAGKVTVAVTTPAGTGSKAQAYTYVAPPPPPPPPPPAKPSINAVQPAQGTTAGGHAVTITGANLTGATSVKFDGKPASSLNVVNATKLTAKTPAHAAGKVTVAVTTAAGTASKAQAYTYVTPPAPKPAKPAAPAGASYSPGGRGKTPATTVMWLGSDRATSYEVQIGAATVCQTEQTKCLVSRLVGPKANVRVRAIGAGGTSQWATATWRRGVPGLVLGTITFGSDRSNLSDKAKRQLRAIAKLLAEQRFGTVILSGHTDKAPGVRNPNHGKKIARDRAKAARDLLARQLGKAKVKITVKALGDREPVASNKTKKGRTANRRVVVTLP